MDISILSSILNIPCSFFCNVQSAAFLTPLPAPFGGRFETNRTYQARTDNNYKVGYPAAGYSIVAPAIVWPCVAPPTSAVVFVAVAADTGFVAGCNGAADNRIHRPMMLRSR